MKAKLIFIVFLFTSAVIIAQSENQQSSSKESTPTEFLEKPEFYIYDWKKGTVLSEKSTSLSLEIDKLGSTEVIRLVDDKNRTVLFVANISTPVCADGECKLMHIRLYWNLLGNYAGFDRYTELPLTKHDHDEFLTADYLKLHKLLQDNNSIFKRRSIDQLVIKPKIIDLKGVDAVSGATIKEVKNLVVDGALYSCYTAWHLVHGKVKDSIKKHTTQSIDKDVLIRMLNSNLSDYQLFALKKLSKNQYIEHYKRIAEIFSFSIPLVRTFIIKNLPIDIWKTEKLQEPFWANFSKVDINSRSLLLNHLSTAPKLVLEELSNQLNVMTKNQVKLFLNYLFTQESLNSTIKTNLQVFSNSNTETYAYLVEQFLENYRP